MWRPPWGSRFWNKLFFSTYALSGGSAQIRLDHGNDIDTLYYWTKLDRLPSGQAILHDAVIPDEAAQSGSVHIGIRQTNHWASGEPIGGNVVLASGAANWKPYPEGWYDPNFVMQGHLPRDPRRSFRLDYWSTDTHDPANRDFWFSSIDPVSPIRGRVVIP